MGNPDRTGGSIMSSRTRKGRGRERKQGLIRKELETTGCDFCRKKEVGGGRARGG